MKYQRYLKKVQKALNRKSIFGCIQRQAINLAKIAYDNHQLDKADDSQALQTIDQILNTLHHNQLV